MYAHQTPHTFCGVGPGHHPPEESPEASCSGGEVLDLSWSPGRGQFTRSRARAVHRLSLGRPLPRSRSRYNRPPGLKPGDASEKVLIHLDSRTVAMEVGIR